MGNKNNRHRVHMFSTKRRPCHFNNLRMTKYMSHIIHSCCATHMCLEHIHTPGPAMSWGNTNTVPRPYVNLVATPPKGSPTGRPPMKEAASYEGGTCGVLLFCGWYSWAHGGFVVLLLTYGFRDPGPALPWGRPHFGTQTICKSGSHTT